MLSVGVNKIAVAMITGYGVKEKRETNL